MAEGGLHARVCRAGQGRTPGSGVGSPGLEPLSRSALMFLTSSPVR